MSLCQASFFISGRQKAQSRRPTCPWDRKSKDTLRVYLYQEEDVKAFYNSYEQCPNLDFLHEKTGQQRPVFSALYKESL